MKEILVVNKSLFRRLYIRIIPHLLTGVRYHNGESPHKRKFGLRYQIHFPYFVPITLKSRTVYVLPQNLPHHKDLEGVNCGG